jgi:NAD(P)-dependent dehydrogenase (short-subunit alcohol dehydrogenase family)
MSATVVVTGAARGIGAAIAERYMRAGWDAILADVTPAAVETARRLEATHGSVAASVVADVSSDAGRAALLRAVDAARRPVGALVNNAGITRDAVVRKMTEEQFRLVCRVNLGAAYELTTALVPRLGPAASVVNLSSKSANGNVGQLNYALSKAGLIGLTRSLALELAPRVRVNAVAPAFIATEMTDAIPDELRARFIERIPFGRAGEPAEVAEAVFWLSSPESSYVTGQVLAICGGRSFAP